MPAEKWSAIGPFVRSVVRQAYHTAAKELMVKLATRNTDTRFYWLVPAAFLLHCAEELPRFQRWATKHFGTTTTQFYLASHAVLVPVILTSGARGAARPHDRRAAFLATSVAAALGLNAIFHIAAYTLYRTKRDNLLADENLLGSFLTGTALSTAAVASLYLDVPRLGGTTEPH